MSKELLTIARSAARIGGEILNRRFGNFGNLNFKGRTDLVSDADVESEEAIISFLADATPGIPVTSEEIESSHGRKPERWILDPLDGTTNFVHGYGQWGVSLAYEKDSEIIVGIVLNPHTEEEFSALKNGGANLNGEPIVVSNVETMIRALSVTGFPYDIEEQIDIVIEGVREMLLRTQGLRRLGSAALDLCFVAAGRFDLYWEFTLNPWDIAAGSLILTEAGGKCTSPLGEPFDIEGGDILASNGLIHDEAVTIMREIKSKVDSL